MVTVTIINKYSDNNDYKFNTLIEAENFILEQKRVFKQLTNNRRRLNYTIKQG